MKLSIFATVVATKETKMRFAQTLVTKVFYLEEEVEKLKEITKSLQMIRQDMKQLWDNSARNEISHKYMEQTIGAIVKSLCDMGDDAFDRQQKKKHAGKASTKVPLKGTLTRRGPYVYVANGIGGDANTGEVFKRFQ